MSTFRVPHFLWLLCALAVSSAARAQQESPPTPRELHAASCVAALEVLAEDYAEQIKAGGHDELRETMMDRLISGTAFVGDSYLHGLNDQQKARRLADDALEAQKSLSPKELKARQESCADEGTRLYASSNALVQAVVTRFAKRRYNKLLGI